ncbi:MAG: Ig-like domain-containing protein [Chloroflexi bacterium]|nr:Ig-like domain-containing protein [Chloroflexota bacterium]
MRRILFGLLAGIVIGATLMNMSGVGQAAGENPDSESALTAWVPDLKEIMTGALRDLFSSASVEANDPEIAEFYGRLTNNMLTTIEAESNDSFSRAEVDFPLVRITFPANQAVVSDLVSIHVDAVDDKDPIGTLTVRIAIDGTTTIEAAYSPESGFYEASWDSNTVTPGTMHVLTCVVTDSLGNSQSASAVVLVRQ